ncbi:hypothetical protein AAC387_Pa07g1548 [Persea americana]
MEGLLYLCVMATSEEKRLRLGELSSPPHRLEKICLAGLLEKLPHWIGSLANLSCLYLDWSKLQETPLPLIGSLANVVFLWLNRAYEGQRLHFLAGCFSSLSTLILKELKHLNHVRIDQEAMPSIQEVSFLHCQKLKLLLEGTEQLSGLQELFMREMPEEFTKRLREDASEDRKRVSHIPIITNAFWSEGKWLLENLSQCLSAQTWTSEGISCSGLTLSLRLPSSPVLPSSQRLLCGLTFSSPNLSFDLVCYPLSAVFATLPLLTDLITTSEC